MKKLVILGILIFIVSMGVGYLYSTSLLKSENAKEIELGNNMEGELLTNNIELQTIEAVAAEQKVTPNTEFAIKEFYDECGHFKFEYAELPKELINLTKQEVDDYYNDEYEVEELENNSLIITKEINGLCDNHFMLKLGENQIEIYKLNTDTSYSLYKKTDISREYLPKEDIEQLEEGIYLYRRRSSKCNVRRFWVNKKGI